MRDGEWWRLESLSERLRGGGDWRGSVRDRGGGDWRVTVGD